MYQRSIQSKEKRKYRYHVPCSHPCSTSPNEGSRVQVVSSRTVLSENSVKLRNSGTEPRTRVHRTRVQVCFVSQEANALQLPRLGGRAGGGIWWILPSKKAFERVSSGHHWTGESRWDADWQLFDVRTLLQVASRPCRMPIVPCLLMWCFIGGPNHGGRSSQGFLHWRSPDTESPTVIF